MNVATPQEIRALERNVISPDAPAIGIPEFQMIREAGAKAAEILLQWSRRYPAHLRRRFLFLIGKGKNGADAHVAAAQLHREGEKVFLCYCTSDAPSGPAQEAIQGLPPLPVISDKKLLSLEGTILVDGLLGIGFRAPLNPGLLEWIRAANASGNPVVSLDVPSGLEAETGIVPTDAVRADLTITMGLPKTGLFLQHGPDCAGEIQVADFSWTKQKNFRFSASFRAFAQQDARRLLRPRPRQCHKNSFGRVAVCAGSAQYIGAPFLAAEGALRAGAGVTTLLLPEAAYRRQGPAALIVKPLAGGDVFRESMLPALQVAWEESDAIAFGPGIGKASPGILQALLKQERPVILDADALRLLAQHPECRPRHRKAAWFLTPHPGEMAALLRTFCPLLPQGASRISQAVSLADALNATIVLKGCQTIVAHPGEAPSVNLSGGPALATPGTGDVLCGVLAALAAQHSPFEAAELAVFLHGRAAELYPGSPRSLLADDLPELLGEALWSFSAF